MTARHNAPCLADSTGACVLPVPVAVPHGALLHVPCNRRQALNSVRLSGPTLFAPVIQVAAQVGGYQAVGGYGAAVPAPSLPASHLAAGQRMG